MWSNWFWLKLCVVLETYKREFSLFVKKKSRAVSFLCVCVFVLALNNKMFEVSSLRLFFRCERLKEDESSWITEGTIAHCCCFVLFFFFAA